MAGFRCLLLLGLLSASAVFASAQAKCWIRMPSGCNKALSETSTPTIWFVDPHNQGGSCQQTRLNAFNTHCGKTDAENHWGPDAPREASSCDILSGDRVYLQAMTHGNQYVEVSGRAGGGYGVSTRATKIASAEFKIFKWSGGSGNVQSGERVYLQAMTHGNQYVEVSGRAGGGYGVSTRATKIASAEFQMNVWTPCQATTGGSATSATGGATSGGHAGAGSTTGGTTTGGGSQAGTDPAGTDPAAGGKPAAKTETCLPGVCAEGTFKLYYSGKTKAECSALCEEGRRYDEVPDQVSEDVYQFGQNGQFHDVMGGLRKASHERKVDKIWYPSTGHAFSGFNFKDHFYGHWEGEIEIEKAGNYEFFTTSDDGSRMFIDNERVVYNPGWHGMKRVGGKVDNMAVGKHTFWAEMFEGGGGAGMIVEYQGPDTNNRRVTMPASAFPDGIKESAYQFTQNGQFHDVTTPVPARKPTTSRKVANVNYPGTGNFWKGWSVRDHFYARWSGYIEIKTAGDYTFYTESDDGSRMFIDDNRVVYNPGWHGMRTKEGTVKGMTAGKHPFSAEMFEGGGGAGMILRYKGPDTGDQKIVIPESVLSGGLQGTGTWELNKKWQDLGECGAYSYKGGQCLIYTKCDRISDAKDNTAVCEDNTVDWVGPLNEYTTCKYE